MNVEVKTVKDFILLPFKLVWLTIDSSIAVITMLLFTWYMAYVSDPITLNVIDWYAMGVGMLALVYLILLGLSRKYDIADSEANYQRLLKNCPKELRPNKPGPTWKLALKIAIALVVSLGAVFIAAIYITPK